MQKWTFVTVGIVWMMATPISSYGGALPVQERADLFLRWMNAGHLAMARVENEAQWKAVTDVTPEHQAAAAAASEAAAAFRGNAAVIREVRFLLQHRQELRPITVRQLERVLLGAAEGPMTNPRLVAERVRAETAQAAKMNSYTFRLHGRPITANQIDHLLQTSMDLKERLDVWLASKEIGPVLKPGLVRLQRLRNAVAKEVGFHDYFALSAARYGMTTEEILQMQEQFLRDLWPLYVQLHTWAKYQLAKKFHQPVPDLIPAHWINNRWAQEWTGFVPAMNLDAAIGRHSAQWVVRTAERYFTSMGLPPLPPSFWEKSDLYPVPPDSKRKKNPHASCWHIDLEHDIRALMNVEPNTQWFFTAHHELGHGHYDLSYARPEIPPLLRGAPCPAFHEAMAMLAELGASQPDYLRSLGLIQDWDEENNLIPLLLEQALSQVVPFMFWASGVMTHWEADLYARNLPPDQWNHRWWQYKRMFQGIEPPVPRGEEYCDPATKTHINDAPCYYYSYAIATVIKFQLHDYIAREILHQSPYRCTYAGNKKVGAFLRSIMEKGATEDWRTLIREATGQELSTKPMMNYFRPLLEWLKKQNAGRRIGWSGAWLPIKD